MVYVRWAFVIAVLLGANLLRLVQGQCSPLNILITSTQSRQLTVSWQCHDGGTVELSQHEYQVTAQLFNLGQCQSITDAQVYGLGFNIRTTDRHVPDTSLFEFSTTINGLNPYSSYAITITSRIVGTSRTRRADIIAMTSQEVPSAGPANVRTVDQQSTRLTFAWDEVPCGSRHGDINYYIYSLNSDTLQEQIRFVKQVIFTDLSPGTKYTFRVAAVNLAGSGETGSYTALTISEIDRPASIDTDNILSTSIRFSWSETTCSGSCSNGITGYTYRLMQVATGDQIASGTTGANERMVTIRGLTPCTEYVFSVAGISGSVTGTYSSELLVTTDGQAPGRIISLSVTTPQTNTFLAEWEPPFEPCPPNTYTIEYRLTDKDQCEQTPDSSRMVGTTEAMPGGTTIAGLLPYSTYEVFVRAVNSYGNGLEASRIVTTLSQEPTSAPSDVKVTSTDLDSLSFSWGEVPCGSRNGEITEYGYQLLDENDMPVISSYFVTSARQITIDSLLMCTTYTFRVRASGNGNGPYSESIAATTSTPVTNLNAEPVSSTELLVSWEAATESCSDNVEYGVEYRLTNRGQCQPFDDNAVMSEPMSGTTVKLSDLHPYSTYEIQVRASGSIATISFMTDEAAPSGHPADVDVMSTTNTTIQLTWDKPVCAERNGNITGYTYSLLEMKSSSTIVQDMETTDTRVLFTDLAPSTSYTFSLSANTRSGKGPLYSVDTRTQGAGTVTLSGIRISAGSKAGSVDIRWEVPDVSHGDVIFYHIRYWKADEVDNVLNQRVKANDAITMYTINGLDINSDYHFQIQAETAAGKGSWSDVYVLTIPSGSSVGVIVGSSVAAIFIFFIIAVLVYRLKMSNPNKTRRESGDVQSTGIGMSSRIHSNKHHQAQQHTARRGNNEDGYDNPDPQPPGRSTSVYYEDLDTTTMNKDQEYQSIDNNENQPRGYQNIEMSKDEGQTQAIYDADYEMPEPDERDKHSGNYEGLDKTGMEKDHEYQALGNGNTQPRPYQNVNIK